MVIPSLTARDALLVVDVQNDFLPGGALAVPEGDRVIPVLNRWIDAAGQTDATVAFSRDWHPRGHVSFTEQGGPWPVHCLRGTEGAAFGPDLHVPTDAVIVSKGESVDKDQYSAFDGTGLADELKQRGVDRVWVGGLAQDVCVRATVLDAIGAGFEVHLIAEATRPVNVNPEDGEQAMRDMIAAGAVIERDGRDDT